MRKLLYIICFGLIIFPVCQSVAQKSESVKKAGVTGTDTLRVSGTIMDMVTKKPLYGVYVSYKDFGASISDSLGQFSISVPDNKVTLLVKADGYADMEIPLKGRNRVDILLQSAGAVSFYNEVTLPSGLSRRNKVTGAVESIQTSGNWTALPTSVDNDIQGKFAGLNAVRRSGTPAVGANLFLRGFNSLYATNQPIIIVDGVYYDNGTYGAPLNQGYYNNPLSFIDLKDIEDITIIKDATSTYGAKGANGAILITTSRAHQEATSIDASVSGGSVV